MWARVVEIMIGCWLLMSPFIFGHRDEDAAQWATDLACGTATIILAGLAYWHPLRQIHLLTAAIAGWLFVFGRFLAESPSLPAAQNNMIVGLLLLMFALIPNHASHPPRSYAASG